MTWLADIVNSTRSRPRWLRMAVVIAVFVAGLVARAVFARPLTYVAFLPFFPAPVLAAALCGWRLAALTVLASVGFVWFVYLPPAMSFEIGSLPALVAILGFAGVTALLIALVTALTELKDQLDRLTRLQDSLFREMQHRVANNLQTVGGMLLLARREVADTPAADVLDQAGTRIAAMAQLHRKLHSLDTFGGGLEPILQDLLGEAFHGLPVAVRIAVRDGRLTPHQMTLIALLVNEAAINAARHVFRPKQGTRFEVSLAEAGTGRWRLLIQDDGPGLREAAPAAPRTRRLGMAIMRDLAAQLGGSLDVADGPGTTLRVDFAPA